MSWSSIQNSDHARGSGAAASVHAPKSRPTWCAATRGRAAPARRGHVEHVGAGFGVLRRQALRGHGRVHPGVLGELGRQELGDLLVGDRPDLVRGVTFHTFPRIVLSPRITPGTRCGGLAAACRCRTTWRPRHLSPLELDRTLRPPPRRGTCTRRPPARRRPPIVVHAGGNLGFGPRSGNTVRNCLTIRSNPSGRGRRRERHAPDEEDHDRRHAEHGVDDEPVHGLAERVFQDGQELAVMLHPPDRRGRSRARLLVHPRLGPFHRRQERRLPATASVSTRCRRFRPFAAIILTTGSIVWPSVRATTNCFFSAAKIVTVVPDPRDRVLREVLPRREPPSRRRPSARSVP